MHRTFLWTNPTTGQTGWKWEVAIGAIIVDGWPYNSQAEAEQALKAELEAQCDALQSLKE